MPRRRWPEAQMRELLREHERSGVSMKAFAEAADVPYTTLSWWRTLRRARADEASFVPARVRESARARVEILVGDLVVRVVNGDDAVVADLRRRAADGHRHHRYDASRRLQRISAAVLRLDLRLATL